MDARPVSKVGWDVDQSQDMSDGVFNLHISSRRLRGQNMQVAPDRTRHAEEDDTQDIPELEDGVDIAAEVAVPPRVMAQRVPTMKELDSNMPYLLPYIHDGNIDLRPLIAVLTPVSQVVENDELWEPDVLLRELEFKANEDKENSLTSPLAHALT